MRMKKRKIDFILSLVFDIIYLTLLQYKDEYINAFIIRNIQDVDHDTYA